MPSGIDGLRSVQLTDAMIKTAVLPEGKHEAFLSDAVQPGLLLRIRDTGAMTFQFRAKDSTRITLGRFPAIKVAAARRAAAALAGDQARGIDVFRQQSERPSGIEADQEIFRGQRLFQDGTL